MGAMLQAVSYSKLQPTSMHLKQRSGTAPTASLDRSHSIML